MANTPIVEYECRTVLVDTVVRIQRVRGLTHIILAETRPTADNDQIKEVVARLAMPNEEIATFCAALMASEPANRSDKDLATADMLGRA